MAKKKAAEKRILKSFYMDQGALAALDKLSKSTKISKSDYVREAIEDLLAKHGMDAFDSAANEPARKVNYLAQEVRIWWDAEDKAIHLTPAPGSLVKGHTTFTSDPSSERWHKSMFRLLGRTLAAGGKPGPKVTK